MLLSLALIFLCGLVSSEILSKLKIPGLVGMMLTGIVFGPYVLNWMDPSIQLISIDLRQIALVVILLRVGLQLDLKDLKVVGRPALLLSFLPAFIEVIAIALVAHFLFSWSVLEAALLGSIIAAVSPAVVVPRMLHLMDKGIGTNKRIPQMILAGASMDDIFVIVLFTSLIGMWESSTASVLSLLLVPVSIVVGILVGGIIGYILVRIFKYYHIRDTAKVLILLGLSFLFVWIDGVLPNDFPFSGLLAVVMLGGMILKQYEILAKRLVGKFSKIWVVAEVMLFVLVGAAVDISILGSIGLSALVILGFGLLFRMVGVFLATSKTNLNIKERLYVGYSYLPKATVQAAIGSIPLSLGVASGNQILAISVLAIFITAPLGAFLMDHQLSLISPPVSK
jgi:NhaP-type Na+/H+ or K+/H+ antiporter